MVQFPSTCQYAENFKKDTVAKNIFICKKEKCSKVLKKQTSIRIRVLQDKFENNGSLHTTGYVVKIIVPEGTVHHMISLM